ncbi:MAG: TPM domain-containing protein [Candidatus Mcinerneyibacterium aminivorans]|jgi:uncharacterized protein|uniref:TPM domain-containing protein n=1 Tax=Candidatus Mcinerneyibacterium aminivorans TaxID=2703815 RepID=A0A5D0MHJ2_9BACT|nr:MAG: TPM domain-containing protein [Candidatus Mcinerneyibacterium aminivorans]
MKKRYIIFLFLFFFLLTFSINPQTPPKPTNFFVDNADVLNTDQKQILIKINNILQNKTGAEIAVLIEQKLEDVDPFNYSVSIFESWKPGSREKDNGILILLIKDNKNIEVRTGYGVEGFLPDGKIGRYIDKYFIPYAQNAKLGEGVINLVYLFGSEIAKENGFNLKNQLQGNIRTNKNNQNINKKAALPGGLIILLIILYIFPPTRPFAIMLFMILLRRGGGFGGTGGFGGGFGGFGGGSTGGGGAGRSW